MDHVYNRQIFRAPRKYHGAFHEVLKLHIRKTKRARIPRNPGVIPSVNGFASLSLSRAKFGNIKVDSFTFDKLYVSSLCISFNARIIFVCFDDM